MITPVVRVVVMGVAGSGKTTVGEALAERLAARFVDADDAHPPSNIAKMSAGTPLTDEDRWPWLEQLRAELAGSDRIVVTCSALKRSYRDVLRQAGDVRFVHLDIDRRVAAGRLADREGHFMREGMVAGQFDALEPPDDSEADVTVLDGRRPVPELVADALAAIGEPGLG